MTGTAGAGEARRLDELAAVTREYARYANERAGVAGTIVGGWLFATFVIALRSATWGRTAALWAPVVSLVVLALGRRLHQRRGIVVPVAARRAEPSSWWVALLMAAVTGSTLLKSEGWMDGRGDPARFAVWLALVCAPVIPLLFDRLVGGGTHRAIAYMAVMAAFLAVSFGGDGGRERWIMTLVMLGMVALLGLMLAAIGVAEARQFARPERRLAALRSPSA